MTLDCVAKKFKRLIFEITLHDKAVSCKRTLFKFCLLIMLQTFYLCIIGRRLPKFMITNDVISW